MKRNHVKKVPPPLCPLPYHLIPKKLVTELGINPPLVAAHHVQDGNALGNPKDEKKRLAYLNKLKQNIEVYEVGEGGNVVNLKDRNQRAGFLGIANNNDQVTKILMTKEDQLKLKQSRQVVFGQHGPIIDKDPQRDQVFSEIDSMISSDYSGLGRKPMIDQMREELAVNK